MSLAGIAISIGVLVDGAIAEVENAYTKLERWQSGGGHGDFHKVRLEALLEVGPSVFFSLLVIAVAFLPIFTLVDQEGNKPARRTDIAGDDRLREASVVRWHRESCDRPRAGCPAGRTQCLGTCYGPAMDGRKAHACCPDKFTESLRAVGSDCCANERHAGAR